MPPSPEIEVIPKSERLAAQDGITLRIPGNPLFWLAGITLLALIILPTWCFFLSLGFVSGWWAKGKISWK